MALLTCSGLANLRNCSGLATGHLQLASLLWTLLWTSLLSLASKVAYTSRDEMQPRLRDRRLARVESSLARLSRIESRPPALSPNSLESTNFPPQTAVTPHRHGRHTSPPTPVTPHRPQPCHPPVSQQHGRATRWRAASSFPPIGPSRALLLNGPTPRYCPPHQASARLVPGPTGTYALADA